MAIRNKKLNRKPKLSRSDKWKRNPVPWLVILMLTIGLGWHFVWKDLQILITKNNEIKKFEEENLLLEEENEKARINLDGIRVEFTRKAGETLAKEEQIFPEEIDTKKTIKVLEIFSLLLNYDIDGSNYFSLESVNFSKATKLEDDPYSKLKTNIKVLGTKANINNFVDFIKTGEIPKNVEEKIQDADYLALDVQFLGQNLLPLATLDSLRITKQKSTKENSLELLSVELQVNFYSQ